MNDENLTPEEQRLFKFFVKAFNQVFDEALEPALDGMENDIKEIRGDVEKLKYGQDRMERKLDLVTDKYFDHDGAIKNYDKRIKKLESRRLAA